MAIPDYQTLMLPLLRIAADGAEHRFRSVVEQLAVEFQLTDDERKEMLPSGTAPSFDNRVGWARTYLKQAGLLNSVKRGYFQITDKGRELLSENPPQIDVSLLDRYEEFRDFPLRTLATIVDSAYYSPFLMFARRKDKPENRAQTPQVVEVVSRETPEDSLAAAYKSIRRDLELELLDQVKSSSPSFFERLVVDLLVKMGYGGSRQDAGKAIGRSSDEGIDGIIKEDKLGLDVIYVQAKRWEATVGRPEIQKFAGALQGQRARKGVFITTSNFSREAEEYAFRIESKIILIDGDRLASLMVDNGVGVSTVGVYELKKVDTDYFEGE